MRVQGQCCYSHQKCYAKSYDDGVNGPGASPKGIRGLLLVALQAWKQTLCSASFPTPAASAFEQRDVPACVGRSPPSEAGSSCPAG